MLVHWSPFSRPRSAQNFSSSHFYILLLACTALHCIPSSAQTIVNGQIYSKALAVVDAPQPGSTYHAGSALTIAIDTSGNGKLSSAAMMPNSGLSTSYDSLELYLISSQTGVNLTISSGSGLLTQESGSTVKHLNWAIPSCLDAGAYNLTLYEGSRVSGISYYSITPLSLILENANPGPSCDIQTNALETQPQVDSAPQVNPWLGGTPASTSATPSPTPSATSISLNPSSSPLYSVADSSAGTTSVWTLTVGPSGLSWPIVITTATHTATSLDSAQTVTRTIGHSTPPSTVTVVLASFQTQTFTLTGAGLATTVTTTATSLSTTTAIMQVSEGDTAGFFPVSAAPRLSKHLRLWTFALSAIAFVTLL